MIYLNSLTRHGDSTLFIAKENGGKSLYVYGAGEAFDALQGEVLALPGGAVKRCALTNANAKAIRALFPFTRPSSHKGRPFTLGLGDRLGLASAGHIRLIRDMDVFPVLAQQSIRELNLTGRTYDDVLASAVWAVFQEGYRKGWGADGDHLKTREEVKMALDSGFTMITLDCSEHIKNSGQTPEDVYGQAIGFTVDIYNEFICGTDIDFELSIDETQTTTSPEAHRFVAQALKKADITLVSLAPRFIGEFQKGIDYRGDLAAFEKDFKVHEEIAKEFGYKLSIHSGSDKFAVFPVIYRETGKNVHVKTAGTNWLEAVRVIAGKEPALYRKIHETALKYLPEAKKYYHITENTANIPALSALKDEELPGLLEIDDARQVLHVTYGFTLKEHGEALFTALNKHEESYYAALAKHIGRHL
ncbi:MAG: tagaturonate epimerase family protein [Oscillospiraceae bacterium]|jgi:hypothetical protein|nr:tagaturonate epimerase family protein [Oscillospiraceae bacterium]